MNFIKSALLTLAAFSVAGAFAADDARIIIGSVNPEPGSIITQFNYTRITLSEPESVASVEQVGEISYQVNGFGALGSVTPGYPIEAVKTRGGDINLVFTADAVADLQDAGKWPVIDPGQYVITIPEGALKVTSSDGTVYTNDLITLSYDLLAPVTYISTPAEDEIVAEFDKITLQFPEYQALMLNEEYDVTLRNNNGEVLPMGEPTVMESYMLIPLADGVCSVAGTYTFYMAPGSVTLAATESKGEQINPAITFTFECIGNQAVGIKSISPEPGVVELLAGMTVIYTKLPVANPDCTETFKVYCNDELVFETLNTGKRVQYAMDNDDPNKVTIAFAGKVSDFLRAPGVYRVEMPEGFMMFGEEKFRQYSEALSLEYIIQDVPKYTVSPVEGNVDSLSEVTLTFADVEEIIDNKVTPDANGDGAIELFGTAIDVEFPEIVTEGNSVTFKFSTTHIAPGAYTLNIPSGTLTLKKSNGEEVLITDTRIQYAINNFPAPTATPEPGEYESLGEVTFTLAEGLTYSMWLMHFPVALCVIDKGVVGKQVGAWSPNIELTSDVNGATSVTLYPKGEYDLAPGDYVLRISPSTFMVNVAEGYPYISGVNKSVLLYPYTIVPSAATEMTPEYEDGHEFIGQMSSFNIYFEKADELTLEDGGALPVVTGAKGEAVPSAVEIASLTDRVGLSLSFNPAIDANGEYVVTIPAGMMRLDGHANPEYVLTYKVNGESAVEGVNQSVVTTVYGIDGTVVMRNADSAAVSKLPRGLYIINGKKVVVR